MRCKLHFNLNSDIINKTVVVESIATPLSVSGTKGSDDDDVRKKLALHGKKKKKDNCTQIIFPNIFSEVLIIRWAMKILKERGKTLEKLMWEM